MKRLSTFLISIFLIGIATAGILGGIAQEDTIVDRNLKASLDALSITTYEKSVITCDDNECWAKIKSSGKFDTTVKISKYKIATIQYNQTFTHLDINNKTIIESIPREYLTRVLKSDAEIKADIKTAEIGRLSQIADKTEKPVSVIGQESEVTIK